MTTVSAVDIMCLVNDAGTTVCIICDADAIRIWYNTRDRRHAASRNLWHLRRATTTAGHASLGYFKFKLNASYRRFNGQRKASTT